MKILYRRCAGLDVHKQSVSACIRIRKADGSKAEVLTLVFATFTEDLQRLRDWLREHRVHEVAMESTGVYWIPVWNVLERSSGNWFHLTLINPQHVRALPGRKTDQQDCERIAELHQYGLLARSFIPPQPIRQLRDLTRRRTHLQQDRNRVINRIGRLLETANCKLGSVASDIVGRTGKAILRAIAHGETGAERLSDFAFGTLQNKKEALVRALQGRYTEHFRWLLKELLEELSRLDDNINRIDQRLSAHCAPYSDVIRRLCTIPTVKLITARILLAELGTDMTQFADSAHAASWAGLCPGNNESAGKRQSGRTRKGNYYLRRTLIQNAWAVSHMKDCYLTGVFFRIAARRGMKKAALAIAHKILVIAFHVIRDGDVYHEVGADYQDQLHPEKSVHRLTRRLATLGFAVTLTAIGDRHQQQESPPSNEQKLRKKGRPCHCQKRGILCIHGT